MFTYESRENPEERKRKEAVNGTMSPRRSEDILAGMYGEISFGLEKEQLFLRHRSREGKASLRLGKWKDVVSMTMRCLHLPLEHKLADCPLGAPLGPPLH